MTLSQHSPELDADAVTRILLDLFSPQHRADPYPLFAQLREAGPLHETPLGVWVVTRHAECTAVLQNPSWGHNQTPDGAFRGGDSFLFMNPPQHTRLRSLVSRTFTPRMITGLAPRIEQLVDELLDAMVDAGDTDLIAALAYPLPMTIVCELLGVPAADYPVFHTWSIAIARGLDPEFLLSPEEKTGRDESTAAFYEYFRDLARARREHPAADLISALAAVDENGDGLSDTELHGTGNLLLNAGHETSVNLIGNGLLALLRRPDQLAALHADPELIPSAVQELLRFDAPIQLIPRDALTDLELADRALPADTGVAVLLAAANRDPAAYPDPDRLDITRFHRRQAPAPRHLAFSLGVHFCLGAGLALLEMEILLRRLIERGITLDPHTDEPDYKPNVILRGPERLPVSVRQQAPRDARTRSTAS
ncbi:cytochrome [Parafrankia colletiae]|uniref:Cytochrome n=1 Tax=Parafrankia colletiae TaxID=573497 RepID=A0A1S1QLZ8_9ACTN|nr:cytochrome P450 [Parafrankia colletiae]MCK9899929.1 cytochrome P450 [Frankia sp. Cpl3]OHV34285.1 cytochrome [Parafrankia colletiae]